MKKVVWSLLFVPYLVGAEVAYSFFNLGLNYNSWRYSDFLYISAEYGASWRWGEFYGNSNVQNPLRSYTDDRPSNLRLTMVNDFDVKLSESFRVHMQDYHLQSELYFVNDAVLGFSYKYVGEGLWFKPFIGAHYTHDTYFSGVNGYMSGWLVNYKFEILEENFSLFQWNEIEFLRERSFYEAPDGTPKGDAKSYGLNGAIKCYWHPTKIITTGVEYRYSKYKRGTKAFLSALIYTAKYNF